MVRHTWDLPAETIERLEMSYGDRMYTVLEIEELENEEE